MSEFTAAPIHPGGSKAPDVAGLVATWRGLNLRTRVVVILFALLGGVGSAYASYVLVREVHHWAAWALALLVLDPIALASFVFLAVLCAPDSIVAPLLGSSFRHAKLAALLVGVGLGSALLAVLGYVAWELWKAR